MTAPSDRAALRRRARQQRVRSARLWRAWQSWWSLRETLTHQPTASRWVVICAYCHRLRLPGGLWRLAPPRMLERTHIGFEMTHGACDDCLAHLTRSALRAVETR